MSKRAVLKRQTILLNGLSEQETDSSESEDEMSEVAEAFERELAMSESSSSDDESDETDDIEQHEKDDSKSKKKKKKKIHWQQKQFAAPVAAFGGTLPAPPTHVELQPIDYFYSMFGHEFIRLLMDQSNLYSVQKDPNKPVRVTEMEMNRFIGVLMMTGIYSFPEQRFFWTVDNSTQPKNIDPNFDRAYKVRLLLNIIRENFQKLTKEEQLSVDEQIIPFKGKSIMKQHMPNKPNRWGYKMLVLAGGKTGICYDFIRYTGKGESPQYDFCTNIVLDLCETVSRLMNHKIYFDNYFTTIRLQVELKRLGIYAGGTVRFNRLPDLVMKTKQESTREGRGAMDYRIAEVDGVELCATRWYDNNVVNCLSTLHGCDNTDLTKRWSSKEKNSCTYLTTICNQRL
ncbi:unnamed protein product [Rotaria magnacalcarata]